MLNITKLNHNSESGGIIKFHLCTPLGLILAAGAENLYNLQVEWQRSDPVDPHIRSEVSWIEVDASESPTAVQLRKERQMRVQGDDFITQSETDIDNYLRDDAVHASYISLIFSQVLQDCRAVTEAAPCSTPHLLLTGRLLFHRSTLLFRLNPGSRSSSSHFGLKRHAY